MKPNWTATGDLACSFGEPWLGPHPKCAEFARAVQAGIGAAAGYTLTVGSAPDTVLTVDAWNADHLPHLTDGAAFTMEPLLRPSGDWYWVACPCGAKHLRRDVSSDR